jgi:hypothetical protein
MIPKGDNRFLETIMLKQRNCTMTETQVDRIAL